MRWLTFLKPRTMPETIILAGDSYNRICATLGVRILSPSHAVDGKRIVAVSSKEDISRVRGLDRSTKWYKLGSIDHHLFIELFTRFGKAQPWVSAEKSVGMVNKKEKRHVARNRV